MQIDAQEVLSMAEQTGKLVFFDLETANLTGDYGKILVASLKPYGKKPITWNIHPDIGSPSEEHLVAEVRDALESFPIWVSYYGKMFDVPMLRSRLLFFKQRNVEPRHHLDMYFMLKSKVLTSRRSQAHYLRWLDMPEQKMDLSPAEWGEAMESPKAMRKLVARCESDVRGLEQLYKNTRHLVVNIERR